MRLSVVIPTYNTASMTLKCVRAVRATMPADTEIIVVDDASTDDTSQLLERGRPRPQSPAVPAGDFPDADRAKRPPAADEPSPLHILRLEKNHGFAHAANRGVSAANGDIILLLNSDAIVHPGALDAFLRAFEDDEKLGVAGAQLLNEDGTNQWSGGPTPTLLWIIAAVTGLGRFAPKRRRVGRRKIDWVSGAAMAFRREVWEPLPEHYRFYCQDIDFCLRASERGWKVRIIDEARVIHGLGKTIGGVDRKKMKDDLLTWGKARYGRAWWLVARLILVAFRRS